MGGAGNPVYDASGDLMESGNVRVENPNFQGEIPSGTSFYAIYDSIDCTYYPIQSSGGTGVTAADSGYCDYTPTYSGDDVGNVSTFVFGSGLQIVGSGSGEVTISADHYIYDGSYCEHAPTGEAYVGGFFNSLVAGSGLRLAVNAETGVGGSEIPSGECAYRIDADHYIRDEDYCNHEQVQPVTDYQFFNKISFGTGLRVSGIGDSETCEYSVYADHYIIDEPYCDWEPPEHLASGQQFFNRISVGTGLWVNQGEAGDCDWRINADHQISDTGTCGNTGTVDNQFFTQLVFNSGLNVIDEGGCKYSINADHLITDTETCGATATVEDKFFRKLIFKSGLRVSETSEDNCEYTIDADHRIMDTETCGRTSTVADYEFFNRLNLQTGLYLIDDGECEYSLYADHYLKDTTTCNRASVVDDWKFFTKLNFQSGLYLADNGDCEYSLQADHYLKDTSTCGKASAVTDYEFFTKLNFDSGLYLSDEGGCEYTVRADHYLKDTSTCNRASVVGDWKFFTKLNFQSGLYLADNGSCEYSLQADHYVKDEAYCTHSPTVTDNEFFTKLWAGTGLQLVEVADCTYRINADHYIQDLAYCDWSPSVGNTFFNKLELGTGLRGYFGTNECIVRIDADHYIKDEAYCDWSPTVATNKFFTHLRAGTGLQIVEVDQCDFRINADHYIADESYCNYDAGGAGPVFFNELRAGTGLQVELIEDCKYRINADHYIIDEPYCDWEPPEHLASSQKFFNRISVGTGLWVNQGAAGDCDWRINADHHISSTGAKCAGTESINNKFFTHLSFTSGIGVKAVGDCKYEIWSCPVQVRDSGYCDWVPSVATSCTDAECIVFGTGLKITSLVGGNAVVAADHEIKGTDYCDHTTVVPDSVFFNKLIFDSGLQVIKGDDCDFTIYGDHYVKDEAYCDHTPAANVANNVFFNKLWAGTGLQLEKVGDDCIYRINADHNISDLTYCGSEPAVVDKFFNHIKFGDGLYVTQGDGDDNCSFTIDADHYITDTAYCDWTPLVADQFFRHLRFGNGLFVIDNGSCDYTIHADHYIYDSGYCDYIPSDPIQGESRFFDSLIFGSGLKVLESGNGACNYRIDADHYISSTGATCAGTEDDIDHEFFTHISFTDRMGVKEVGTPGDCKYEVWACPIQVRDSGYCDWVPSVATSCADAECIVLGTGLKITSLVDGNAVVAADHYIRDENYCDHTNVNPVGVGYKFFNKLRAGTGLKIDSIADCEYRINADHYISATGSTALGGTSGIKPTEAGIDNKFFTHLSFTDRMGVRAVEDTAGDCKYEVWSQGVEALDLSCLDSAAYYCEGDNLKAADPLYSTPSMTGLVAGRGLGLYYIEGDTPEKGMHYIESTFKISSGCYDSLDVGGTYVESLETVNLGCGLSGTPIDYCGSYAEVPTCAMTISLNPLACKGDITDVRYVDDICCTGGGLEIIYKHLRFSSCGLFTGVTGTDSC
jgi:hypothetical protein